MSEIASEEAGAPGGLVVRAVLRTDVGLVRSENQDFATYTTPVEERQGHHPGGRLLVVADGMGGHRGGATASRIAGETVKAQYLGSETTDIGAALRDALTRANARVFTEAQSNPDLRGMGTTTSVLALRGNEAWFGHVGDSRIYRVRGDEIEQLTEDHSLVASMVREGLLTASEAETHPRRNVLQRSIGVTEEVEIDVRGPFELQEGDTFILCSDGLHGVVKEPELKEVVKSRKIHEAADEFVKLAIERGAPDNVTVIVARVERAPNGDETVTDDPHMDDTQDIDPAAFDETMKEESDPREARPSPGPSGHPLPEGEGTEPSQVPRPNGAELSQSPRPVSEGAAVSQSPLPTGEGGPKDRVRGAPVGMTPGRWILLVFLFLGAAGAWLLFSR
jgi:serine/threonine protein phosphatase PrpC